MMSTASGSALTSNHERKCMKFGECGICDQGGNSRGVCVCDKPERSGNSDVVAMPRSLTAENGAKALLMGEFSEWVEVPCGMCDGDGYTEDDDGNDICPSCTGNGLVDRKVTVSWTTIKAIYAKAVEHLASDSPGC